MKKKLSIALSNQLENSNVVAIQFAQMLGKMHVIFVELWIKVVPFPAL